MKPGSILNVFVLALLAIIWGSSFILMKRGLFDTAGGSLFAHQDVAAFRLFIAGLFLSPVAFYRLFRIRKHQWPWVILVGMIGNGIPAFLFTLAQTQVASGIVGTLNTLTPLFTFMIGTLVFKAALSRRKLLGVAVGFAGAVLLILSSEGIDGTFNNYAYLVVLAALCYGTSVNIIHYRLQDLASVDIAAVALFLLIVPCGYYLLESDFIFVLSNHPEAMAGLGYLSILGVVGTALALVMFNGLIKRTSGVFASTVTYLIPIVAMTWGMLDGEPLGWVQVAGGVVILSGVYIVNSRK